MWDPALVWSPLGAGAPEVEAHEIVDLATAGTEARAFLGGGFCGKGKNRWRRGGKMRRPAVCWNARRSTYALQRDLSEVMA